MTLLLAPGEHPADVQVFAGPYSLAHIGSGAVAALVPMPWGLAVLALFLGYQVSQAQTGEAWSSTGGELVEFALGAAVAGFWAPSLRKLWR